MSRPDPSFYSPFMETYISQVKGNSIEEIVPNHHQELLDFYLSLPEEKQDFAYESGKWTVKEVLEHVIDNDLIFSYRALAISRGEQQRLPGYDQDPYMANTETSRKSFASLKQQFQIHRDLVKHLVSSFSENQLQKIGSVSDYQLSVNAACFVLFGHALHHKHILETRYL